MIPSFTPILVRGPVNGWPAIALTNTTASNDLCNQVNFSWALSTGSSNDIYYKITKSGLTLTTQQYTTNYTYTLDDPKPVAETYTLSAGYGPNFAYSVPYTLIGGPPRTLYTDVTSFTATSHTCDKIDLTWDNTSSGTNTVKYLLSWEGSSEPISINKGTGALGKYSLSTDIKDTSYNFTIKSVNKCGFESSGATVTSNFIELTAPTNLTATISGTASIILNWTAAQGPSKYFIKKSYNGITEIIENISKSAVTYTDANVQACINYKYEIYSVNNCNTVGLPSNSVYKRIAPVISNTFVAGNLEVSKGYYPNKVLLQWNPANNATIIENYRIYRKINGSTDPAVLINTVSASTRTYNDMESEAGVIYEYSIDGTLICDGTFIASNQTADVGFRSPSGVVSGHVEYTGGIAVKDAKVTVSKVSGASGSSISFNGTSDYISVPDVSLLDLTNALTIEAWVKPSELKSDNYILSKGTAYSLYLNNKRPVFVINGTSLTFATDTFALNEWRHIAATYDGVKMKLYVNGSLKDSATSAAIPTNTNDLFIGRSAASSYFKGNIDELRISNIAKTSIQISNDYNRVLNGDESGTVASWNFDEGGTCAYIFDKAKIGSVYAENTGTLNGAVFSSSIPAQNQLGFVGITDANGDYTISGIRFNGIGENFRLTPELNIHQFTPSSRTLFIGEGASVQNGQNFQDISAFRFTGNVTFKNTICPSPDVMIYIDGVVVIKNGQVVKSDDQGLFEISVPIGEHQISLAKNGHIFSQGKFPPTGYHNFQENVYEIAFEDATVRTVVGRVVGGSVEAKKPHILGRCKNNIGSATITFISEGNLLTKAITTNSVTGEFLIDLPPLKYTIPNFSVNSNSVISFKNNDLLDLTNAIYSEEETDTVFVDGIETIDFLRYNKKLDFVYYEKPTLKVANKDGSEPFKGDTIYSYKVDDLTPVAIDLKTYPFTYPVFTQGERYTAKLSALEIYENKDAGIGHEVKDYVPVLEGVYTIANSLSETPDIQINISQADTLYSFTCGAPNVTFNAGDALNFTNTFAISLTTGSGTVSWKSVGNEFRGFITGAKAYPGQSFFSQGPELVDYILRDPPGSNSFTSLEKGTSLSSTFSWDIGVGVELNLNKSISLGTKFTLGLGLTTETKVTNDWNLNLNVETKYNRNHSTTETSTLTETWKTSSEPSLCGSASDIYIGKSRNINLGIADNIDIIPATGCGIGGVVCANGSILFNGISYRMAKRNGFWMVPGSYATSFAYTENHIVNTLIPNLIKIRDQFFSDDPSDPYYSYLPTTDPNYGTNNDDPVWGADASTTTPLITNSLDADGKSYKWTYSPTAKNDTIRWYNQQIRLWKEALQKNEKEKYDANLLANYSISSGVSKTYTAQTENTETTTHNWEINLSEELKLTIGATIGGVGAEIDHSLAIKQRSGIGVIEGNSDKTAWSYTLYDPNEGDQFSVDVKGPKDGSSPVFDIKAGMSMCPYEEATYSKYHKVSNNFVLLSGGTLQKDKPALKVNGAKSAILVNIPADQAAVFNLELINESVTGDNQMYNMSVIQKTNPNGALLKIDGSPLFQTPFAVPFGSINKQLVISRGPTAYEYDNIGIVFHSQCQYSFGTGHEKSIGDTIYVSVHFLPTCSKIEIIDPQNQWVANAADKTKKDILTTNIAGYDINFTGLDQIKFYYKPTNSASWTGLETWYKNTTDPDKLLIPRDKAYISYPWNIKLLSDGNYDIKAVTVCKLEAGPDIIVESEVFSGIIDRVLPQSFGNPQPADGILSPNDEIQINFNEPINAGLVTNKNNFDVRGVLNKSVVKHDASLNFNGIDNYMMIEDGISLKNSFSVQFWVNRTRPGFAETLFSQGINAAQSVSIGFNTANQVVFNFVGQTHTSSATLDANKWYHVVCTFDETNGAANIIIRSQLVNVETNTTIIADYTQNGRTFVGKSSFENKTFAGYVHGLRIWNKVISYNDVTENMNIDLTGNESNLVGCWRMDDVRGTTVKDYARSRNATISGATWAILPSGKSISFDGVDDYLVHPNSPSFSKEMDFTVEFWMNVTPKADTVSLISNGNGLKGNTSWCILASPDGKIHVKSNGYTFTVNTNVVDNSWHHFALVVNRIGNTFAYVDGNLVSSISSENWDQFGGPKVWIGSRGWFNEAIENRDKYFNGNIDEVRIWSLARKQEQIDRDMVYCMKGDEAGLQLYLPFELYVKDVMNNVNLETSTNNKVDSVSATLNNGAVFSPFVPTVKLERPVSSIPFTYVVNNDKIIITPSTSGAEIENVTLDITCKNIKDMNGNTMECAKTWIAYIDKNQVKWQDQELSFDKVINTPLTFKANILNNGGQLKTYAIRNLPSWLTVDSENGVVLPNSLKTITFTVSTALNIGNYEQAVFLSTDFGYNETLWIKVNTAATAPAWTVNPDLFQFTESVIGQVIINDIISNNPNNKVAAFVGDECRGVANLRYLAGADKYLVFLDIYSNAENTEAIQLKIWDASEGKTLTNVLPNIVFASNEVLGTIMAPVDIRSANIYTQEIQLAQGWKWVSFNLADPLFTNVSNFLSPIDATTGDMIKSQTTFLQYDAGLGWLGSLLAFNDNQMYMFKLAKSSKLTVNGAKIKSVDFPISIKYGWNWISFIPSSDVSINDAFGNYNPRSGDIIKNQYGFAMYDAGMGWLGSLTFMKPGLGYMFKTSNPGTTTLIYPEAGLKKTGNVLKTGAQEVSVAAWDFTPENYQFNTSIIAETEIELQSDFSKDYVVGAFVGETCKGIAEPIYNSTLKKWIYFITVYGNVANEKVNFKIINTSKNEIFEMNESVLFNSDEITGTLAQPMNLTVKKLTSMNELSSATGNFISISPNPLTSSSILKYQIPESQNVTISIYNQMGVLISTIVNSDVPKGIYTCPLNEKTTNLKPGVYFIKLVSSKYSESLKVVKIN